MKRIAIFAHPDKPEALHLASGAKRELEDEGFEVRFSSSLSDNLADFHPHLAAVFGGDGTVLAAVSTLGPEPPPIAAFNLGRIGYLAENQPMHIIDTIHEALAGELQGSERIMIEGRISGGDRQWSCHALNEIVIISRINGHLLPVSVSVNGEELMEFRGDGIILATPTGSTGYALSAGGPVVSPELSAIILAPVCPHMLANRSMVLEPRETVLVRHYDEGEVEVTVDGRAGVSMGRDETLEVKVSARRVTFLFRRRGRYQLLRGKLGWGWDSHKERPRHG